MTITICESSSDGHRRGYVTYFGRQAERLGRPSHVEPSLLRAACAAGPLVIPMLEQRTGANLLAIALRALTGRRTLCLVFRAGDAARSPCWRHRFKRGIMAAAKRLPRAGLISIVPVPAEPAIAAMVNGWIYDPELCDLDCAALGRVAGPEIAALREQAGGRIIVAALGRQVAAKGFAFFCDVWLDRPDVRDHCLFVVAGGIPAELADSADRFAAAGGVVMGGYVSDDTLLDIYAVADAIWCCYAPEYDQASGIFGRAVQFARTALVRRGSHVERFAAMIGHPAVAVEWQDGADAAAALLGLKPGQDHGERGAYTGAMISHNADVFGRYLG